MTGVRKALIVATDQYSDPKLTRLNAPAEDARALAEVLRDPDVGAYEVETVLNKTCQEVEIAVASFFQSGARDDTLLVHFSCHGVKDLSGELYFATTDTNLQLLKVTGVASSVVKDAMEESRASLILCLVDCCYSGAFTKSTKAAATIDLTERLGGRGRAVITASTSLQLALDGQEEPSLFTHAVVEGLQSGEADRDLDGLVTLDEFYNYIHEKVTEKNPDQTPVKSFDVQGEVYVARRGGPITTPAPLPRELSDTLATGEDWQRRGAVSRLTDLLNAGHPGRALAARLELERVRDHDDSNKVRMEAAAALEAAGARDDTMPEIPDYHETVGTRSATITPDSGAVGLADLAGAANPVATEAGTAETTGVTGPVTGPVTGSVTGDVTGQPTGGGGSPKQPSQDDDGGRGFRRWGIPVAAALSVLLLVVVGWGVAKYTGDDPEGDARSDGVTCEEGDDGGSALSASELLTVNKDGGKRQLIALDVDSGKCRPITLDQVALPTLSQDRTWMFYLVAGPGEAEGLSGLVPGEPRRVQVDGAESESPLLKADARLNCPKSTRPSESLDGLFAIVCKDVSGTVQGLFVASSDGRELDALVEESTVKYGPTWERRDGEDTIIYAAAVNGDSAPTVLMRAYLDGSTEPVEGPTGWVAHPDWSESGLLYVRSLTKFIKGQEEQGVVYRVNDDDTVTRLTKVSNAESPAWSPDGTRFVYAVTESPGVKSLWVQDNDPNAKPVKLELTGDLGPPAWGPR